jgi:cell division protein FtsW
MALTVQTRWGLFNAILLIAAAGMVALWSASSAIGEFREGSSLFYPLRQLLWAALSLGTMLLLKRLDYRIFNRASLAFTALWAVLILLFAVRFLPAQRWYRLGAIASFQPSEFAKPALVLFLAYLLAARGDRINDRKYTLIPVGVIVALVAGTVMGPDLGTGVVLALSAIVLLLAAGMKKRYLLLALLVGLSIFAYEVHRKPYRIARIFAWVNPSYSWFDSQLVRALNPDGSWKLLVQQNAPTDKAREHLEQSLIAVGSGRVFGKGPMASTQKLLFLPESHTDFIFAIVAEEYGLIGALALLGLYLYVFWQGCAVFSRAPDLFGKYLALGVTLVILFQALINMSVVTGILPTKGIPLPLVSYGGSSYLSTMISLGLLQSVSDRSV